MNAFEELLQKAVNENVRVHESFDLNGDEKSKNRIEGLYVDGNIALDKDLSTTIEKSCVLAEELGHYHTTSGDILDQTDTMNRKQEYRARLYGYNLKIGLLGIIKAYEHGCRNLHEMAEYLDVTEQYLQDALNCYKDKYGLYTCVDDYIIYFIPNLSVCRISMS